MRKAFLTILLPFFAGVALGQSKYQKDFAYYWQTVNDNFAYFERQHTNWDKVKAIYQPVIDTVSSGNAFMHVLESINNELHNGHVFLNRNDNSSNRLIPTGADLKVSYKGKKFVITEIREGFNAGLCGLKTGMVVAKYNGMPIEDAIQRFLPKSVAVLNKDMYEYAANMLLAGTHNIKRNIAIAANGQYQEYQPDKTPNKTDTNYHTPLDAKRLPGNIGYIKVNNSLGNSGLIKAFDMALDSLMDTDGLIFDLSETPSGGSAFIAKAMMGRFIDKELPYQKHIYTPEEKETGVRRAAIELVAPRLKTYKKPLVVLVGYWTGSMGEGIAIGFDAMKRATIVGSQMAGLLGEIYSFETPEEKIPFSFPCVQLQHINGQPREDFMPHIIADSHSGAMKAAIGVLSKGKK